MGTFPTLPALDVKPTPNPLETMGEVMGLRGMLQEQNTRQLQQQVLTQQVKDVQARTAALKDWDPDHETVDMLGKRILNNGGSADSVMDLKKMILDQQLKWSEKAKNDAETGSKQIETAQKANDMLLGHMDPLLAKNGDGTYAIRDEDLIDRVKTEHAAAKLGGYIDPAHSQQVEQILATGDPSKVRTSLEFMDKGLRLDSQQLAQANKERELKAAETTAGARQLTAQTEQQKLQAQMNPQSSLYAPSAASVALGTAPGAANIKAGEVAQAAAKAAAEAQATIPAKVAAEVATQKALAPQLAQIASVTRAGRQYINREDIPEKSKGYIEQQAAAAGIPVVDKDVAGTLSEIDTAKANQQSMLDIVAKKLPSGPGERIYKGPENKLQAAMQTDPDLVAMGTFRNAAIQSMRAVAGSKGLRINQYEVQLAIDNDIPKMTDTWSVAQAKIANLNRFLENSEVAHLVKNRATGGAANADAASNLPAVAKGFTRIQASDGSIHDIPSANLDAAKRRDPGLKALGQ